MSIWNPDQLGIYPDQMIPQVNMDLQEDVIAMINPQNQYLAKLFTDNHDTSADLACCTFSWGLLHILIFNFGISPDNDIPLDTIFHLVFSY